MSNPDPESVSILLQILLLIFLTALNAFFSASEMAMVSLSRTKVEQKASEGDKKYINLVRILNQPSNFLSTIQIGITLINILAGASLADVFGTNHRFSNLDLCIFSFRRALSKTYCTKSQRKDGLACGTSYSVFRGHYEAFRLVFGKFNQPPESHHTNEI